MDGMLKDLLDHYLDLYATCHRKVGEDFMNQRITFEEYQLRLYWIRQTIWEDYQAEVWNQ